MAGDSLCDLFGAEVDTWKNAGVSSSLPGGLPRAEAALNEQCRAGRTLFLEPFYFKALVDLNIGKWFRSNERKFREAAPKGFIPSHRTATDIGRFYITIHVSLGFASFLGVASLRLRT